MGNKDYYYYNKLNETDVTRKSFLIVYFFKTNKAGNK